MATGSAGPAADEARSGFVRDVAVGAQLPAYTTAESAAVVVMGTVAEGLTTGAAHELVEAMPVPIRQLLERPVEHHRGPPRRIRRADLLETVADQLGVTPRHAEGICRAVLGAVRNRIPEDVAARVGTQFPADVKALWLAPPSPATAVQPSDDELERARADIYATIERSGALPAGIDGAEAFMAVMCIFAQRLSGGEARNVLFALPNTVRPLVGTCMLHRDERATPFGAGGLLARVAEHLGATREQAEPLVRAVFAAVKHWLPDKDVADAAGQLPDDLKALWLQS
jgi:uncharacterized protein (DUF2267 family)